MVETRNGLAAAARRKCAEKDIPHPIQRDLLEIIRESIEFGLAHRDEAVRHSLPYAREMNADLASKFIGMYVNGFTSITVRLVARPFENCWVTHATKGTSMLQSRSSSSSKNQRFFLGFSTFLCLLHDERFHPGKLLLKTLYEIAWSVLEQDDEGKSQNDKENQPEKSA